MKTPDLSIIQNVLPDSDILGKCIHCGMCLATCPTYDLTKMEKSSPRGRIQLIKAVADGRLEISGPFVDEMNFCLDCQACETACPAGVKYGRMVEAARVLIEDNRDELSISSIIKKIGLNYILTSKFLTKMVGAILFLFQKSGLLKLILASHILRMFDEKYEEYVKLLPVMKQKDTNSQIKELNLKPASPKFRIAFLSGCIMDVAFSEVNKDTIEFLLKNDCEVVLPENQVCCGSLHAHNGEMRTAIKLMKQNLDCFDAEEYDYLVTNSAGCGAFMKEYAHLLEEDEVYAEKARRFSSKVLDFSEFVHLTDFSKRMKAPQESVTYHDACHLAHSQKITQQSRAMILKIPGISYKELNESSWCCGSAGIYNITRYEDSMKFLEKKMSNITPTGSDVVLTANPGCMLQIEYGIKRYGLKMKVEHPATFLNRYTQ